MIVYTPSKNYGFSEQEALVVICCATWAQDRHTAELCSICGEPASTAMLRAAISNPKEHLPGMSPPDATGVATSSLTSTSKLAFGSIDVADPTRRLPAAPATSVAPLAVDAETRAAPQSPLQGTTTE